MQQVKKHAEKHKNVLLLTVGLVVLSVLIGLVAYSTDSARRIRALEDAQFSDLIVSAANGISSEAVVEPQSGEVYFPEAKLKLPAYPENYGDRLLYYVSTDSNSSELVLGSKNYVRNASSNLQSAANFKDAFDKVPSLQGCINHYVLKYELSSPGPEYAQVHAKSLANGKDLYIFQNKNCLGEDNKPLTYITEINSY